MGTYRGSVIILNSSPACLNPTNKATHIAPIKLKSGVPTSNINAIINDWGIVKPSIMASIGEKITRGNPVSSQWEIIFPRTIK